MSPANELGLATGAALDLADSEISHEVCCVDEEVGTDRISMCGIPIDDGPFTCQAPTCVVCLELIDRWAYYVDKYGEDPHSPGDKPCRVCPKNMR